MLKKVILRKLFNRFDYEIVLKKNGITIITGPNGYGKSTILKCIEALYEKNLNYFMILDFSLIEFIFTKKTANITFKKKNDGSLVFCDVTIPRVDKRKASSKNAYSRHMLYYDDQVRYMDYQDRYMSPRDNRNSFIYSYREYDELFSNMIMSEWIEHLRHYPSYFLSLFDFDDKDDVIKLKKIVDQLNSTSHAFGQLHFVKEQRLVIRRTVERDKHEVINAIEDIPSLIKKHIGRISSKYSSTANRLDSTYPERLFGITTGITSEEYELKMVKMNEKFEKINKYDISNLRSTRNVVFKDAHAIALKVYFDDFDEKYKVYEDFIQKLDLFTNILNNMLSFKEIRISTEDGIKVVDKDDGHVIDLKQLSSGEMQEIVMFYNLIFEAEHDSMLLIDEPEISLHILWQKKFMDDLLKVVNYKKIHTIVATHSPQIISNHWDSQIDLGELYGK
ncbi:MAG: AAA family ATPase [Oscillospiraceae bacterium]|jgi:predicted ATP-binding protein involved in virulence|nr:AAA family ATPase [Oscillospiraceae bacterium]